MMESLVGEFVYSELLNAARDDPATQRRILLAKWMYIHGLLNCDHFPSSQRFVPVHMEDGDDDY